MAARPKYPGPADAVVVDLPDGSSVTVKRGDQVPNDLPGELRDQLAEQWKSREDVAFTAATEPEPVHIQTTEPTPGAADTTEKEG